jgi:hypothetical protein
VYIYTSDDRFPGGHTEEKQGEGINIPGNVAKVRTGLEVGSTP